MVGKPEVKSEAQIGLQMDIQGIGLGCGLDWSGSRQEQVAGGYVKGILGFIKYGAFLDR